MTVRLIDVLTLRGICNQQNLSLSMQELSSATVAGAFLQTAEPYDQQRDPSLISNY